MIVRGARRFIARTLCHFTQGMSHHGFSIIEALIAMAIGGVIVSAVYAVFISSNQSYRTQDHVASTQQGARLGIDFVVRDIRMAGLDPLSPATDAVDSQGAGIKVATGTKIRFTSDIDMDGIIEEANFERLTYEYDAANDRLQRCLYEGTGSESWQTLIDDVTAMTFTYLDPNDTVTATLADIRTVAISITCEGTDSKGDIFTRTLNTRVRCRNL